MLPSSGYPQKKGEYEWSTDDVGDIDLEHFVKMETKDGVYKPSKDVIEILMGGYSWEYEKVLRQNRGIKLTDLGIHTVQFRNNANYSIDNFYDCTGIKLKASKSVLESYPDLRQYSENEKAKEELKAKEKAAEEARLAEIKADTYSLVQDGKVILKDVRSHVIEEYFEDKQNVVFTQQAISAAKVLFDAAPELDKIFFGKYGIYSYTELSGEKFADFEDIEYVNKLKGIKLPKRVVTLYNEGVAEFPYIDKYDTDVDFEKGATYVGVERFEDGEMELIYEDGDQGI
jgi:hypothetical protein